METPFLSHTHCTLHPVCVCEKEGGREGDGDHQPTAVSHPHPIFAENTHAGTQADEAHAGLTAPRETSSRPEFFSQMQKSELTAPPPPLSKNKRGSHDQTQRAVLIGIAVRL